MENVFDLMFSGAIDTVKSSSPLSENGSQSRGNAHRSDFFEGEVNGTYIPTPQQDSFSQQIPAPQYSSGINGNFSLQNNDVEYMQRMQMVQQLKNSASVPGNFSNVSSVSDFDEAISLYKNYERQKQAGLVNDQIPLMKIESDHKNGEQALFSIDPEKREERNDSDILEAFVDPKSWNSAPKEIIPAQSEVYTAEEANEIIPPPIDENNCICGTFKIAGDEEHDQENNDKINININNENLELKNLIQKLTSENHALKEEVKALKVRLYEFYAYYQKTLPAQQSSLKPQVAQTSQQFSKRQQVPVAVKKKDFKKFGDFLKK